MVAITEGKPNCILKANIKVVLKKERVSVNFIHLAQGRKTERWHGIVNTAVNMINFFAW